VSDDDKTANQLAELRGVARELLDAEEAHRMRPTLKNASRLARARRAVEALLPKEPAGR
jgi:hypothetical protein